MGYSEKIQTAYLSRSPGPAMKPNLRRRVPQRAIYIAASLLLIFLFYVTHHSTSSTRAREPIVRLPKSDSGKSKNTETTSFTNSKDDDLPCRSLPGASDVVVILKTGSTELQDKLPVHLNTTLRCYPNYLIFSDYEETYDGEHIYDALEFTTPSTRSQNADFDLWRRLQKGGGRSALRPAELSGPISRPNSATGKPDNPGWKLDKWKFMPMVNRTLMEYPDKKWYVFVETDTYILWQTLLNYLSAADWTKPYYIGGQIWIGDIQFAHGGTGFAISQPALQSVVKMFRENQEEWEAFTDGHWAGDCVLGKAMKDSGSPMTMAWPIWQGDDIGNMDYERVDGRRLWCFPTVSYHHLGPDVVKDLWEFEQGWIAKQTNPSQAMHHHEMYTQYILPRIQEPKKDWFNHANEDRGPVSSLAECAEICEKDGGCVQYALSSDNRCLSSTKPNLGEWYKGIESGWMPERMKKWAENRDTCKEGEWLI